MGVLDVAKHVAVLLIAYNFNCNVVAVLVYAIK